MSTTHVPPLTRRRRAALLGAALIALSTATTAAAAPPSASAAAITTGVRSLASFGSVNYGSAPTAVVDLGGVGYFLAVPSGPGGYPGLQNAASFALMRTDGTAAGTTIVSRFTPRVRTPARSIDPTVVVSGGALWIVFSAREGDTSERTEVWTSDGTTSGTRQAWTPAWGPSPSEPQVLASSPTKIVLGGTREGAPVLDVIDTVNGTVQHVATDGAHRPARAVVAPDGSVYYQAVRGWEVTLWRIVDGTAVPLSPLDGSVKTGSDQFLGQSSLVVDTAGLIWFTGTDYDHGLEPWVSDGTAAGTRRVVDTTPGTTVDAQGFTVAGDATYYAGGGTLWRSDGGTLTDLHLPDGGQRTALGNALYFLDGPKLTRLDNGATEPVKVADAPYEPYAPLLALNGSVLFGSGYDLWRTSGTAETTARLGTVGGYGAYRGYDATYAADRFGAAGGITYFTESDPQTGFELWRVNADGSIGLVADINRTRGAGVTSAAPSVGKTAFFFAGDGDHREVDNAPLWSDPRLVATDGTIGGTRTVATFREDTGPVSPVRLGSKLYFLLNTSYDGSAKQLWSADAHGAHQVGSFTTTATDLTVVGHRLFGRVTTPDGHTSGVEVYDHGHRHASKSLPASSLQTGQSPVAMGTRFVFELQHARVTELWRSDGTSRGTQAIPHTAGAAADAAIFGTRRGTLFVKGGRNPQLWLTDTKGRGARPLTQLRWSAGSRVGSAISGFTAGPDGTTYFFVGPTAKQPGLWRTDGTARGTRRVKALPAGYAGSNLVRLGRHVAFVATLAAGSVLDLPEPHPVLWKSDGTRRGTTVLHTFGAADGVGDVSQGAFVTARGQLYFSVTLAGSAGRLWTSDGTPQGTAPSADAEAAGLTFSGPLSPAGDRLALIADSAAGAGQLFSMRTSSAKSRW